MCGIEIDRLLKAIFGTTAVAGCLADHPHQTIGLGAQTLLPEMLLAHRDGFSEPPLIRERRSMVQEHWGLSGVRRPQVGMLRTADPRGTAGRVPRNPNPRRAGDTADEAGSLERCWNGLPG